MGEAREFSIFVTTSGKDRGSFDNPATLETTLPEFINLENITDRSGDRVYEWVCGVKEAYISTINLSGKTEIDIISNLCETSNYNSQKTAILQKLNLPLNKKKSNKLIKVNETRKYFEDPIYIPTRQNKINSFLISITNEAGLNISASEININLIIYFKIRRQSSMNNRDFYIFTSTIETIETQSKASSPGNFQVELSEEISMNVENYQSRKDYEWRCGLKYISISLDGVETAESEQVEVLILSDLCETSFYNNLKIPILQRVFLEQRLWRRSDKTFTIDLHFNKPLYVLLRQNTINNFHLYLRENNGLPLNFTRGKLAATLHLKRKPLKI